MKAARELARTEGWDAVSMRRLADRIGYSANYAYRYFKSRDDILLACVTHGFVRLAGLMRSAVTSVQATAAAHLDFALDEPDLYRLMYGLKDIQVSGAAVGAAIADALGTPDPEDDRITRIWATVHGLAALHAIREPPADRPHLHRLLKASIDDLLRTPHGPTAPSP
ncbi:TetR/AcrR family transcriptional regulator [Streptomyces sp. NPDC099050]|uniref:TetR/AcrR family transcriptional regulator n=1 Tax=Streptomyces sp. NPDC099050 TaxID=3366100 RepID=UPI0037FE8418